MTGILIRRGTLDSDMQSGRSHAIGVVLLQAKVHQRVPPNHRKLGEAWNRHSLAALRENQPYPRLFLRLLASSRRDKKSLLSKPPICGPLSCQCWHGKKVTQCVTPLSRGSLIQQSSLGGEFSHGFPSWRGGLYKILG